MGVHLGEDADEAPQAHTDADGRYELYGLIAGDAVIWARHDAYTPVSRPVAIRAGTVQTVDLVLGSGVVLTGHAWFGSRPMKGIAIVVSPASRAPMKKTETSRDGAFRVEGLPLGEMTVLATAAQWEGAVPLPNAQQTIVVSEEGEIVVDFHFPLSTATLSGVVTVDGNVPTEGEVRGEMESGGSYTTFSVALDESGRYRAEHLLPGVATVTVHVTDVDGRSRRRLTEVVIPEGGAVELDFDLSGSASIRGRVAGVAPGEIGQVVLLEGSWSVEAADMRALVDLQSLQVAESALDAEGGYALTELAPGTYTVVAMVAGLSGPDEGRIEEVRYVSETVTLSDASVELDLSP